MANRQKIKEAIESGNLLCSDCPMQGAKEGFFVGDTEVSHACYLCGAVEGKAMGTADELIDAIGEEYLEYLVTA